MLALTTTSVAPYVTLTSVPDPVLRTATSSTNLR